MLIFTAVVLTVVMLGCAFIGFFYIARGVIHRKVLSLLYGAFMLYIGQYMVSELVIHIVRIASKH